MNVLFSYSVPINMTIAPIFPKKINFPGPIFILKMYYYSAFYIIGYKLRIKLKGNIANAETS